MLFSPDDQKSSALMSHCKNFIDRHQITCAESIYQSDRVIENAYEFIEGICDILGYYEIPDEEI